MVYIYQKYSVKFYFHFERRNKIVASYLHQKYTLGKPPGYVKRCSAPSAKRALSGNFGKH